MYITFSTSARALVNPAKLCISHVSVFFVYFEGFIWVFSPVETRRHFRATRWVCLRFAHVLREMADICQDRLASNSSETELLFVFLVKTDSNDDRKNFVGFICCWYDCLWHETYFFDTPKEVRWNHVMRTRVLKSLLTEIFDSDFYITQMGSVKIRILRTP